MAQRRMFNKIVTNNDKFIEMPDSAQNLYFHLSMNADDDGFVDNWKSIMRMTGHKEDDLRVLIAKQYIIPFESGVIVIKHWRLNNYLRNDRFTPSNYKKELESLTLDENLVYQMETNGIPNGNPDKIRLDKKRLDNIYSSKFTRPTLEEVKAYCIERKNSVDAEQFMNYYESNGWKVGKNAMKDWKAAVRTWEKNHQQDKPKELTTEERVKEMLKYEQR